MHVCIIASLTRNQSKFDRCLSQPLVLTLNVSQEVEGQTEPESHGQHQPDAARAGQLAQERP